MSFRQVEVNNSLAWLSKGWELFSKNPGVWILIALVAFVSMLVLYFIPLLGWLAGSVLGTLLFAGMVYTASEQDAGRPIELNLLFRAFQDQSKLAPLVILSLIAVAGALVTLVLGGLFLGGAIGAAAVGGATHSPGLVAGAFGGGLLLWMLITLVIKVAVSALLFFAVLRVMLEGVEPIAAARDSLNAVLANIGPMLVFGLIVIVLSFAATLVLGLGWLVLMPVLAGATYAAYQDVYGHGIALPAVTVVEVPPVASAPPPPPAGPDEPPVV